MPMNLEPCVSPTEFIPNSEKDMPAPGRPAGAIEGARLSEKQFLPILVAAVALAKHQKGGQPALQSEHAAKSSIRLFLPDARATVPETLKTKDAIIALATELFDTQDFVIDSAGSTSGTEPEIADLFDTASPADSDPDQADTDAVTGFPEPQALNPDHPAFGELPDMSLPNPLKAPVIDIAGPNEQTIPEPETGNDTVPVDASTAPSQNRRTGAPPADPQPINSTGQNPGPSNHLAFESDPVSSQTRLQPTANRPSAGANDAQSGRGPQTPNPQAAGTGPDSIQLDTRTDPAVSVEDFKPSAGAREPDPVPDAKIVSAHPAAPKRHGLKTDSGRSGMPAATTASDPDSHSSDNACETEVGKPESGILTAAVSGHNTPATGSASALALAGSAMAAADQQVKSDPGRRRQPIVEKSELDRGVTLKSEPGSEAEPLKAAEGFSTRHLAPEDVLRSDVTRKPVDRQVFSRQELTALKGREPSEDQVAGEIKMTAAAESRESAKPYLQSQLDPTRYHIDTIETAQGSSGNQAGPEFERVSDPRLINIGVDRGQADAEQIRHTAESARAADSGHLSAEAEKFQKVLRLNQIVDKAALHFKNGASEVQIELKPEFLGRVRMQIAAGNRRVVVKIMAELPAVREILESELAQLKTELQNQGVTVDKLDVSVFSDSEDKGRQWQQTDSSKSAAGRNKKGMSRKGEASQSETADTVGSGGSRQDNRISYFA